MLAEEWIDLQRNIIVYIFFEGREKAFSTAQGRLRRDHFSGDWRILWNVFSNYYQETQGLPDLGTLRAFYRAKKATEEQLLNSEKCLMDNKELVESKDSAWFVWVLGRLEEVFREVRFRDIMDESLLVLDKSDYYQARDHVYNELNKLEQTYADLTVDGLVTADLDNFIEEVSSAADQRMQSSVDFGFPTIDSAMLGLRGGEMCLICGWTGSGKTTMGINVAVNVAYVQNKNVVIVTTETLRNSLRRRLFSRVTRLPIFEGHMPLSSQRLKAGQLNSAEIETLQTLKNFLHAGGHGNIMVVQAPANATMEWLRGRLWQYEQNFKVDLLILDDIRNMVPRIGRRQEFEEMAQLLRDFKRIARTHANRGVPVISPYHINRETFRKFAEKDGLHSNRSFTLSGLASSSEAERQTDVALFLWQDEAVSSNIELQVVKMRDGKSGQSIILDIDLDYQLMVEARGHERAFLTTGVED